MWTGIFGYALSIQSWKMLYSSLGKPRGHFQSQSSNIAGAVSILAHMHDTAITHGKSKSVSKHSMCQLVFIFLDIFLRTIWSYFSYFEMARLDNIFKAAGVCIEKTCSQTIWLICFYFCTPWNTWVYSIMPTQTNTFTSPVQPASRVSQKKSIGLDE